MQPSKTLVQKFLDKLPRNVEYELPNNLLYTPGDVSQMWYEENAFIPLENNFPDLQLDPEFGSHKRKTEEAEIETKEAAEIEPTLKRSKIDYMESFGNETDSSEIETNSFRSLSLSDTEMNIEEVSENLKYAHHNLTFFESAPVSNRGDFIQHSVADLNPLMETLLSELNMLIYTAQSEHPLVSMYKTNFNGKLEELLHHVKEKEHLVDLLPESPKYEFYIDFLKSLFSQDACSVDLLCDAMRQKQQRISFTQKS